MTITELIAELERWKNLRGVDYPVIVSMNDWGGLTAVDKEDMQIDLWMQPDGVHVPALNIHRMG